MTGGLGGLAARALEGRRAVVTGASSGIGAASALLLQDSGVTVLGLGLGDPPDGLSGYAEADVRDRDLLARLIGGFGADGGIDMLITAAGVYGVGGPVERLDPVEVDAVLGVNLLGTLWAVQPAMPYLRASRGSVVCIGSIAGRMGGVRAGAHYAASKGAVQSLVRSLAKTEVGNGVRVNGVLPGPVATPMVVGHGYDERTFPMGRWATPEELSQSIVFLASSMSSYTTGVLLDVNGGLYVG